MLKLSTKIIRTFLIMCIIGLSSVAIAQPPAIWGSKHFIPYMPYGPSASQILYVSNPTNTTADINVSVFDDKGAKYTLTLNLNAEQQKVVKLAPEINSQLMNEGFYGTKAATTLIINNPDVVVYASYNVGGADRGFIEVEKTYLLTEPN